MKYDKHTMVSFTKSAVRIAGFVVLPMNLIVGAMILVFAEVLGIIEEI